MLGQLTLLGHTHCVKHSSRLSFTRDRHETGAAQEALREHRARLQALSESVEARKHEGEACNPSVKVFLTSQRGGCFARVVALVGEVARPSVPALLPMKTSKEPTAGSKHLKKRRNMVNGSLKSATKKELRDPLLITWGVNERKTPESGGSTECRS